MTKFTIRLSGRVGATRIKLYKLAVNKECQLDEFEGVIQKEGAFSCEIDKMYAILKNACNLVMLPRTTFRPLQLGDLPYPIYEAKTKNLRFYLIKFEKTGKVILLGGRKSNQKADLKHLSRLIKDIHSKGIINQSNS
jgi:hypothetical protein